MNRKMNKLIQFLFSKALKDVRINAFFSDRRVYLNCLFFLIIILNNAHAQQRVLDFSFFNNRRLGPILMESTFFIYDPLNLNNAGTSFVLAHIVSVDSLTKVPDSTYYNIEKRVLYKFLNFKYCEVLLTAAHVLKDIKGEYANLVLRSKRGNEYQTFDYPVKIRESGKPLWTQIDNTIDIAAMVILLPEKATYSILTDDHLVTEQTLNNLGINTGDDISCLGFPYNTPSSENYFPILRSGKYASYRGTHSLNTNNFLFDFRIYPGNSGGPVFMDLQVKASAKGGIEFTPSVLLGIVSERVKSIDKMQTIEVAKVISAENVQKTITGIYVLPLSYIKYYDANRYK